MPGTCTYRNEGDHDLCAILHNKQFLNCQKQRFIVNNEFIEEIKSFAFQQFLRENEHADERSIILKGRAVLGVPAVVLADQIAGRRKARLKLDTFYRTAGIVYPPGINLEQCSSETTAKFKSEFSAQFLPDTRNIVDLTGGFGVDSYFFSRAFQTVVHVEPDHGLLEIARANHQLLGCGSIVHTNKTAEAFLNHADSRTDLFYLDPSRRSDHNRRVFAFSECSPDVISLLDSLFTWSDHIMVKAAPLLDLQAGIAELKHVRLIVILSVKNECKEVLFILEKGFRGEPDVRSVNLKGEREELFSFKFSEERSASAEFSEPLNYIYEPNSSILKAGAFKLVAIKFGVKKLDPSTHLYTSDTLVESFPGRVFQVVRNVKPDRKQIRTLFPHAKANVLVRNYPLTADELKQKLRISDGGADYLIGAKAGGQAILLACKRIA
jgi:hypothetical protein